MRPPDIVTAPPDPLVVQVRALTLAGLMRQAHDAALSHAPLREWSGVKGRIAASHLAHFLGAPRLSDALARLAWREAPGDREAAARLALTLIQRRGPLAGLEFLSSLRPGVDSTDADARLLSIRGMLLAGFRDFERAHACVDEATRLFADRPWPHLARAHALEIEDRYAEALEVARSALERFPDVIQGIQATAHLLQLLGRDEEAAAVLEDADRRLECGSLAMHLASIHSEAARYAEMDASLDRFELLSPLLEEEGRQQLATLRADAAYGRGDLGAAAAFTRGVRHPFMQRIAERLEAAREPARRVVLPVQFVRQHHKTCVPATLTAITRFWGRPAEHLEVAETICYDGTTTHAERSWAESNGWAVREFTVTWDSAVRLTDLGIPFTLTTRSGEVGHLQALMGYDALRRSFLIRDPYLRHHMEADAEAFLESQEHCGPRGMAMVPAERAHHLLPLDLPETSLHDRYFRFESALLSHDRRAALLEMEGLEAESPGHRLALLARLALAVYDRDRAARSVALERFVGRYPGEVNLTLQYLQDLREQGRRAEVTKAYSDICNGPQAHPDYWSRWAQVLGEDARTHDEAFRWVRRAIRASPDDPRNYGTLANLMTAANRPDRALELHRLAACLGDKDESFATGYFQAASAAGARAEALAYLEARWKRLGRQSAAPAVTLAAALAKSNQETRAFEIQESALEMHPEDGLLLLIAARSLLGYGRTEAAKILLERAQGRCPEAALLAARARLAMILGDRDSARESWRRLSELDPLSLDAHAALARIAAAETLHAALEHLDAAVERTPHHIGLRHLHLQWIALLRPDRVEQAARGLLKLSPRDLEAHVHLCKALRAQGREEEALEQAKTALDIAPAAALPQSMIGEILARGGRLTEAREACFAALTSTPDLAGTIHALLFQIPQSDEEQRTIAGRIGEMLRSRPGSGEGLLAFARMIRAVWEPSEVRAYLQEIVHRHTDLPAAWSALIELDLTNGSSEEALVRAGAATDCFPLTASAWTDLGRARAASADTKGEIEALERALQIEPSLREGLRALAAAHLREGSTERALEVLRRDMATEPPDPEHEFLVAMMLWKAGRGSDAIGRLRSAIRMRPRVKMGWNLLAAWSEQLGCERGVELARELVAERPDDPGVWFGLAQALRLPSETDECLESLQRALRLFPRDLELLDFKLEWLGLHGRFQEALEVCAPRTPEERVPIEVRGRRAWILWMQGRRREAVKEMGDVLATGVPYSWGWQRLAEWTQEMKDDDGFAEASRALARHDGLNPYASVLHGEALLRLERPDQAKRFFHRALNIEPGHSQAFSNLFDALLEGGESDNARTLLEESQSRLESCVAAAARVKLSCAAKDRAASTTSFRSLCNLSTAEWDSLVTATAAMLAAGFAEDAAKALDQGFRDASASAFLPGLWVEFTCLCERNLLKCSKGLRETAERGEPWILASLHFIAILRKEYGHRTLETFLSDHDRRLRSDVRTWVSVLDTLTEWRDDAQARSWVKGWETIEGVWPEAYLNVSLALRRTGACEESARAVRRGLARTSSATGRLLAWAAFDDARHGNIETVRRHLSNLDGIHLAPEYAFLLRLTEAMMEVERAPAGAKGRGFARARRHLMAARRNYAAHRADDVLLRCLHQTIERIAEVNGGLPARVWRIWWTGR